MSTYKQTNINDIEKLARQLQTELKENTIVTDKAAELNDLLQIEVRKYENKIIPANNIDNDFYTESLEANNFS
jgi:hypothetical protein